MKEMTRHTKKEIKTHIKGHNKHLTSEHLNQLSPMALLANAHPLYRKDYARAFHKTGCISDEELSIINTI